jgi:hypothetical protein
LPLFQGLEALLQMRDQVISLSQLLPQLLILLSQLKHFFFWRHTPTLQYVALSGKSLGNLSSYEVEYEWKPERGRSVESTA